MFNNSPQDFISNLFESAGVFILYANPSGNVVMCNKKVTDFIGKDRDRIENHNIIDVLYSDNTPLIKQQMFKAVMDDSLSYKRTNSFDGIMMDKDSNERFVSWNISPVFKEQDRLDGLLMVGSDMTELKEREESLKKIDETLKNIFSSIKDYALYVANLDGNITYYGMGSEQMLGWNKNDIIFKHMRIFHPADAVDKLSFMLQQVREHGKYEVEIELVNKFSDLIPVILTINQFLDNNGNLAGYIFIAKDITERRKLEYQIFQSEKLAAIGQLAAGMAHEINNPLFVISGRLEMILEDKDFPVDLKENLSIVVAQADRIRKLVDRMLQFSRKKQPKLENLDLNKVIEEVLPLISYHKLPNATVLLDRDFDKNLRPVKGDLNQLQEVFLNLLINAYQAMPQGGRISIKTQPYGNSHAEVRIIDTGVGIAASSLKNIFMPFFSTKNEGTGLGLSICYNIIKNHNGNIDVNSQPGRGTAFIIKLPFA